LTVLGTHSVANRETLSRYWCVVRFSFVLALAITVLFLSTASEGAEATWEIQAHLPDPTWVHCRGGVAPPVQLGVRIYQRDGASVTAWEYRPFTSNPQEIAVPAGYEYMAMELTQFRGHLTT